MTATAVAPPRPAARQNEPRPQFRGDATAHMSAGAYLDYRFREAVVEHVYSRRDLAVAPSPGCDPVPVLLHARRARAIDLAEDLATVAALAACIAVPGPDRFLLLACLAAWAVPAVKLHGVGSSLRVSSMRRRPRLDRLLIRIEERIKGGHIGGAVVALTALVWIDVVSGGVPVWAVLVGLVLCRSAFEWIRLRCLVTVPVRTPSPRRRNGRIGRIGAAERSGPVVCPRKYRRDYPGFGFRLSQDLFSLSLSQTAEQAERGEMQPFTVDELHGHLRASVEKQTAASPSASALPDLEITEQCFVSDFHVGGPQADAASLDGVVRRELRFQVSTAEGGSVTNFFTRFTLEGGSLSMWFSPCVIPDTWPGYHLYRNGPIRWRSAALWCTVPVAASLPVELLLSPSDLLMRAGRGIRNTVRGRPELTGWQPPDRGAQYGVRELSVNPDAEYLDLTKPLVYIRILRRRVLTAVVEFLKERNIDASSLEEQIAAVVNYNVVNNGEMNTGVLGSGHVSVTAMGSNASVVQHQHQHQAGQQPQQQGGEKGAT